MTGEISNKLRFLMSKHSWKLSSCPAEVFVYFVLFKNHTWAASVESISSSCSQSSENEGRALAVSPQQFSIIS